METAIIIAIVSSITSIVAVIATTVQNKKINKQTIENSRFIESLKFDIEKKKLLFQIFDTNIKRRLEALANLIESIQKCKDVISHIENSENSIYDSKTAIIAIIKAENEYSECYQKEVPYLEKDENSSAHEVKKIINHVKHLIKDSEQNGFITYTELDITYYKLAKASLNELQNILRDKRTNILLDTI